MRVLDRDPDAYLVVAADKGTAHLSDTANEVSLEYGHWLGDAFASGGSAGYDHKALGITAKGAWESVKRHFGELGQDVMTEPFTVVGIGDMSGDVFGNGMLLSPAIRLVAAFDHRHVFIDPDPTSGRAGRAAAAVRSAGQLLGRLPKDADLRGRRRLAPLREGGAALARRPAPRSASRPRSLPPTELCQAILRAPVDMFWNGGIGTFVKASDESHAEVGDRANDALRIDGADLRCRVVVEGGNLGFTQRGRIEYAAGRRANQQRRDRQLRRRRLLGSRGQPEDPAGPGDRGRRADDGGQERAAESVADDVTAHVLYDNYLQVQILSQESAASPSGWRPTRR